MRKSKWQVACVVAAACLAAREARGTVTYSYTTGASSYTGAVGSTVAVNIYLDETLTGSSTSFIAANGGLAGAGAAVNLSGTTGGTASTIAAGSSFTTAPFFTGFNNVQYDQGGTSNLEFTETEPFQATSGIDPTNGQVLLGTLNVTVGSGTTSYALTSLMNDTIDGGSSAEGQSDGNTLTQNAYDLDAAGNSAYTGTDAAAPFVFTVGPASAAATGILTYNPTGTGAPQFSTSASATDFTDGGTSAAAAFANGNTVYFTDAGISSGTIAIAAGGVAPAAVFVTNTSGTYTFTGGAITGSGSLTKTGAGTLVLSASNTYTGGTVISGGVVRANATNALGSGGVTVGAGAALGGNGSIANGVNAIVVDGTITAGVDSATTGTLTTGAQTWNGSGGYVAKVNGAGTANDRLVMSGLTLTNLTTATPFTVTLTGLGGSPTTLTSTPLVLAVDSSGSNARNGVFQSAINNLTLKLATTNITVASGQTAELVELDTGTSQELEVVAAPEPASLLLLGVAVAPLALGRHRRREPAKGPPLS